MAYSCSSKSVLLPPCKTLSLILLLVLLLAGSSAATRTGPIMNLQTRNASPSSDQTQILRQKNQAGFRYQGLVFNFFPKGTPIPASGPSKRHNSAVNSSPQN